MFDLINTSANTQVTDLAGFLDGLDGLDLAGLVLEDGFLD